MSDYVPKLKGALPKGLSNSLSYEIGELADDPRQVRAAVVLFVGAADVDKLDGTHELHFRIVRWETVHDDTDLLAVRAIVTEAMERRTGQAPIPDEILQTQENAFNRALERDYEGRERVAGNSPRAADLLRSGSGVHVGGVPLDKFGPPADPFAGPENA